MVLPLSAGDALLAIAFVHCYDRLASLLAMGLFATGVSASTVDTLCDYADELERIAGGERDQPSES
jgi:hypothetical protein